MLASGRIIRNTRVRQFRFIRNLFIRTAETPNQDALKFLPSMKLLNNDQTIEYLSGREAFNSPLARKLFTIDGVSSVMLGSNFLTIGRKGDIDWSILKPEVFSTLTDHLLSGEPVIDANAELALDVQFLEEDDEVISMIKELIFTRIRPAIQDDGGDIEFVDLKDDGTVIIRLRGACRSCDSSSATLKNGIEAMLKHYIEEVTAVEQCEDNLDPAEEVQVSLATVQPAKREDPAASMKADVKEEVPPIL